ncbi:PIN domain-containing protein [Aestuariibacter sp. AA17]|uniref:PIN domain-containing protein n=1 Tax=Fluctibacter corallii TaxID=2984329 RepID=A0ABT3ACU0_9ALTE|nr:PIN domain-containing protein [Aestuariibacter sp. AA17]MCV2886465.1 PIN domain-containing protein [Aestuariibacter sp. AA17]
MRFTALLDANILYPAPLRDLFMRLAVSDIFAARWTERIHDEWMRNVLTNRQDLTREQLERTKFLMNSHVRDCLVEDFEQLEAGLQLPDKDDRHVLAAAIKRNA